MAISRALENGSEPHEICRRLMEHYLASDEADKTALASALIVELAARVAIDRVAYARVDCEMHAESRRSIPIAAPDTPSPAKGTRQ